MKPHTRSLTHAHTHKKFIFHLLKKYICCIRQCHSYKRVNMKTCRLDVIRQVYTNFLLLSSSSLSFLFSSIFIYPFIFISPFTSLSSGVFQATAEKYEVFSLSTELNDPGALRVDPQPWDHFAEPLHTLGPNTVLHIRASSRRNFIPTRP